MYKVKNIVKKLIKYEKYYEKKMRAIDDEYDKAFKDVLFINGCYLPHPTRYRCAHQMEQLLAADMVCDEVFYTDLDIDSVRRYRAFVFFRCPFTERVGEFIEVAKSLNKLVIFDIDDLVFDISYTKSIKYIETLNDEQKREYYNGINLTQKTLKLCDIAITTTERLAEELGADISVIEADVLSSEDVKRNPENRCYYCKQLIFSNIKKKALEDGYTVILDGTNASDDVNDRPGMKALQELEVKSPLRECGLTKDEVRKLSKEAGLFTWDKPAYACLATRIPANEPIDKDKLEKIEKAEDYLFSLGYTDFRVRTMNGHARLEVPEDQWMKVAENKDEIYNGLKGMFKTVSLSLSART